MKSSKHAISRLFRNLVTSISLLLSPRAIVLNGSSTNIPVERIKFDNLSNYEISLSSIKTLFRFD